jgi:hypothetical protein
MADFLPNIKPGDLITAQLLNELIDRKHQPLTIKGGAGLNVRSSEGQVQLSLTKFANYMVKGKVASGGITARTSDTSHGTGKVEVWAKNPSTNAYADAGYTISVDYISATAGGLAAGAWVNCMRRADGGWEIVSVDCG